MRELIAFTFLILAFSCNTSNQVNHKPASSELSLTISSQYLNLPVSQEAERAKMHFEAEGMTDLDLVIRLAPSKPDYWVFLDVSGI